ncbi:hypothetical protein [Paraburkholderia rhynchosiae]|uniref:DUF3944 domain-containing protein n=1 Tax=Paraburkholderia rhynchosiae TaxID=487049 RepID=A0A2N7WHI0_9BURK|nr:hypothetical protein [Paraburkholderia rhynchosiae]PMS28880.1 hypothetical protein C0Z16_20850 [Paraburkholderia rhynchosiae]CAB3665435.1 hypothetical protein LMG27174_01856 [Paraburkholderia rhynchosiae]
MKAILNKCEKADFDYISSVLDSYFSLTDDKELKRLLSVSEADPAAMKSMIALMDKQIRYYASSDVAYLTRLVFSDEPGVSADELVQDVCDKLKVNIKMGGSVEAKLERLVAATVEKELSSKSPEDLAKAFEKMGIAETKRELIMQHLKANGKVAILPIVMEILGPKITLGIIETIIVTLIAQIIGREAAKQLIKELLKRNPWINALGPILWLLSGTWLAIDLQGPAFRKTIPITLYLGIVALRDGTVDASDAAS